MKPITREEKLKSWNSLPDYLKEWIKKLTGDRKITFERYEPTGTSKKDNEQQSGIGSGIQGQLF